MRATNDAGRLVLHRDGQPDSIAPFPERSTGELLAEELRRLDDDHTYADALGTVTGVDRSQRSPEPAGAHLERSGARRRSGELMATTRARRVVVAPSAEQLSDDVAGRLVATLVAAQAVRPLAFLAVTAGGILEQVLRALARLPVATRSTGRGSACGGPTNASSPADSPDRNDRPAFAALFDQVAARPGQHPPDAGRRTGRYGDDVDAAAAAYAAELAGGRAGDAGSRRRRPALRRRSCSASARTGTARRCSRSIRRTRETRRVGHRRAQLAQAAADPDLVHLPRPRCGQRGLVHRLRQRQGRSGRDGAARARAGCRCPQPGRAGRYRTLWLIDRDAAAELPASIYSPHAGSVTRERV